MTNPKDRPPKRKLKRRPLPAQTPAMKRWMEYGIADLEDFANGDSAKNLQKDVDE